MFKLGRSRRRWLVKLALLAVVGIGAYHFIVYLRLQSMLAMPQGLSRFKTVDPAPVCDSWKQHMPAKRDADVYRRYIEARKLWRSQIAWQMTRDEATRILKDVKWASEQGDWGARALMAYFYLHGLGPLRSNYVLDPDPEKAVEIARMAAAAGQPWGRYDLGVAYLHGYGGMPYSQDIAWAYFYKAAQLGSPEAQMALADAFAGAQLFDKENAMLQSAFQQGHGAAAYRLGIQAEGQGRYRDALQLYQDGTKFGSRECATGLYLLFDDGFWANSSDEKKQAP